MPVVRIIAIVFLFTLVLYVGSNIGSGGGTCISGSGGSGICISGSDGGTCISGSGGTCVTGGGSGTCISGGGGTSISGGGAGARFSGGVVGINIGSIITVFGNGGVGISIICCDIGIGSVGSAGDTVHFILQVYKTTIL